jgi:hypothetical protein
MNETGERRQGNQEPLFKRPDEQTKATSVKLPEDPKPKEEFKDVFQQHKEEAAKTRAGSNTASKNQQEAEANIDQLNKALSGKTDYDQERELEELKKITPEDMKLAEEMVFRGYAETSVSMINLPNIKFTITSMSADEVNLVEAITYDYLKTKESKDGSTVDVPQSIVASYKNALSLSLAVKGRDNKDLCEEVPIQRLDVIKRAIRKAKSLEISGDMTQHVQLLDEIKKSIRARAATVLQMATPVIDFLSNEKYQFEVKMFRIMTTKQIIPKS